MFKKNIILFLLFMPIISLQAETVSVGRDAVFFHNRVVSSTSEPSQLQYYDFKNNLPDEVSINVFKDKDFSAFAGKHIFVGYGVVNPTGTDCKVFTPDVTGMENNITVCLPWWRIEREYLVSNNQEAPNTSFASFISTMQRPVVPRNVTVCNSWASSEELPGGIVTCTSYYDRTISQDCYNNPKQAKCFKNNCGNWVLNNCTSLGRSIGYKNESLKNVSTTGGDSFQRYESKVDLVTRQFSCPGGSFTNRANCLDEVTVSMSPYECKPNDPSTPLDDSIMKYCDENKPVRDVATGEITGFVGTCPAEASSNNQPFQVICKVNSFKHTTSTCIKRAPDTVKAKDEVVNEKYSLKYKEEIVNVLSGEPDRFSSKDNCVRANTIDAGRAGSTFIKVEGSGKLDDDIYVILHHADNTHSVLYCNQQHNQDNGSKLNFPELGGVVQCIPNQGNYSFSDRYSIKSSDILSIQQATEDEDGVHPDYPGPGSFAGRTHYISSKVLMDGVEAVPEVYHADFPKYPINYGKYLKLWENTLGSLGLMFPYAGSYKLYFYTDDGRLMDTKTIGLADFEAIGSHGFKQLFLAEDMDIAPTLDDTNTSTLCLHDDFVDYGGGVYGGKASISGATCQSPSTGNTYQINHAIKRVVIKDLISGSFTTVPLVYPLGYPNRVFISKLKLYENRIYHCYKSAAISAPY